MKGSGPFLGQMRFTDLSAVLGKLTLANLKLLACNPKVNLIITEKLFLTNRLVFSFCENWKQKFYTCFPPPYFTLYPTRIPNRFCVCVCGGGREHACLQITE